MEKPEPTKYESQPVCPWCGDVMKDAWELKDEQETDCEACLKPILVFRDYEVTYNTYPVSREEEPYEGG